MKSHCALLLIVGFLCLGATVKGQDLIGAITVESTDPNDVHFYLYPNGQNSSDFDELIYNNVASVQNSRFESNNPVIILSHGFIQNSTSQFPVYVRDAYLQAGFASTANIIAVDWGKLSSPKDYVDIPLVGTLLELPVYVEAVNNVYIVGKRVQEFISFLQANGFVSSGNSVHLVGQSLGAHVSGMAGHYYQVESGSSLNRITGTDPAAPGFQDVSTDRRLDSSDANFVDIVHTNAGGFGYVGSLGDVDFFVNGGSAQPECGLANATDFFCSHNLAPRYYAESILTNTIKACPNRGLLTSLLCTSSQKITFGEYCPSTARGNYALDLTL